MQNRGPFCKLRSSKSEHYFGYTRFLIYKGSKIMFKISFWMLMKIIILKSFYFAKQALTAWLDRSKHTIYREPVIFWAISICLWIKSYLTDFVSVFEQNILLCVQNSHPIFEDMNKISLYSRRNYCSARYLTWKLPSCSPEINLLQTLSVKKERARKT